MRFVWLIAIAGLMSCRCQSSRTTTSAASEETLRFSGPPITLALSLASDRVRSGDFVLADISLTNVSRLPLWLNGRLALDREDDPPQMREVWLLVVGPDGRDVPFECMVARRATNSDDYVLLKPHETIKNTEILTGCYRLDKPGHYKLVAFYQDENPDRPPGPPKVQYVSQLLQSAPAGLEITGLGKVD